MSILAVANLLLFFWFHISRKAAQKINASKNVKERFKVSNKFKDVNTILAGDIVLCPWARHFTLTVPLSTQVYKWVPVKNVGETLQNCGGVT